MLNVRELNSERKNTDWWLPEAGGWEGRERSKNREQLIPG